MTTPSQAPRRTEPLLIFLHVPKMAGSTLSRILERQYPDAVFFTYDRPQPQKAIDNFLMLPSEQREKVRVFAGHSHFGVHEYLPQPSTYVTILCDPVECVISRYYHYRRDVALGRKTTTVQRVGENASLEEFIACGQVSETDNGQTRMLAGIEGLSKVTPFGRCTPALLEQAKTNLTEHFSVVGLTEDFDTTLILLKRLYRWRMPYYVKDNVAEGRPQQSDIPQDALDLIHEYTRLDRELYAFAAQRMRQMVEEQGPGFAAELHRFQTLNIGRRQIKRLSAQTARQVLRVRGKLGAIKRKWLGLARS